VTHRADALDALAVGLSHLGSFGAVWIGLALVAAVALHRPRIFALVVVTVPTADLVALALKHATGKQRPYLVHPEPEPLLRSSVDLAFPSGHASTSFAGATLLALAVPRLLAWPLLALAAAISWSRVYVGVHWPSDVLAGALLGAALAFGVRALPRLRAAPRR
jgi:undecaprenyl-diphosphatase